MSTDNSDATQLGSIGHTPRVPAQPHGPQQPAIPTLGQQPALPVHEPDADTESTVLSTHTTTNPATPTVPATPTRPIQPAPYLAYSLIARWSEVLPILWQPLSRAPQRA
ncbi:hypothetical protein [uncultured Bifidobacterium sp.]|uniref:hypothetical protein n=1 Tax=uncultured Bifidobacterium sp. TaxID=165187 RepID=UPI0025875414|nr:hypothetical protein [uncultured Bifidobacterium sp.]